MLTKKDVELLSEAFATKSDIEDIREDVKNFKAEILAGQAEILSEIKSLKDEKVIGDKQDKNKNKVLEIHNDALKRNKILSPEETLQIDQMGAF